MCKAKRDFQRANKCNLLQIIVIFQGLQIEVEDMKSISIESNTNDLEVDELFDLLNASERPVIIAGDFAGNYCGIQEYY